MGSDWGEHSLLTASIFGLGVDSNEMHPLDLVISTSDQHPLDAILLGQIVAGRYEIIEMLARGGRGRVYRGRQVSLNRPVALKILPGASEDRHIHHKRFLREASTCALLRHPNTITIYDYGELKIGGVELLFIAMEYIEGRSLAEVLAAEGRLSMDRALRIAWEIARALRSAHRAGVIHRDLKPANVMVTDTPDGEQIKVVDFGIAKLTQDGAEAITLDDRVVGSPQYMAPEQVLDGEVSPRSDIYSLGVMLYELLSGEAPFAGRGATQTMMAQIHQLPPALDVPGLPAAVAALVMRCLEKDPRRRFNDTAALMLALRELDWAEDDEPMETSESTMWDLPRPPVDLLEDSFGDEPERTGDTEHSGMFHADDLTVPRITSIERTESLEPEQTEIRPRTPPAEEGTPGHYRRMLMGAMFLNAMLLAFVILLLLTRGV
ncbi:MAG: serine/threonine protein kinase [Myxococcota bacterium]